MRSFKAVCVVLVFFMFIGIVLPGAGFAQAPQPITKGYATRLGIPIFKQVGNSLTPIGTTWLGGQEVGIYSFGNFFYGQEYVRTSPEGQFIRRSDLWIPSGNETKSDVRPCKVIDTTQLPLGDGDAAKVEWYKKVNKSTPLFAVGMVGTAAANPIALAALAANPEAVAIGVIIVGGVVLYKIYEQRINDAVTITKATLFVLASQIAAATITIPDALAGVPSAPDHIRNHPRGAVDSAIKMAIWNLVWNQVLKNIPPDWCGYRSDGAYVIVYFGLQVFKITGGVATRGVGIIFNPTGNHTGVMSIKRGTNGRPQGGTFDPFVPLGGGCNPFDFLTPATN